MKTEIKIATRQNTNKSHYTIYVRCTIQRKKVEINTGVFIPIENWNSVLNRVVAKGRVSKAEADEFNQTIAIEYEKMAAGLEQLTKGSTKADLLKIIFPERYKQQTPAIKQSYSLLNVCEIVIDHSGGINPRRYTSKGGKIGSKTIQQYHVVLNTLKKFQEEQKVDLGNWDYIKTDFYVDFKNFLYAKGQIDSSVDKFIKALIAFMNYIYTEEILEIPKVNLKKWKRLRTDDQTIVYLLNDEYNILQNMPIDEKHLDRTRDLFCFQTDNCLRVGDLMRVRRHHFSHDFNKLMLTHEKTNTDVFHMQTTFTSNLIKKYDGKLQKGFVIPNDITEQVYNRQLKDVIKLLANYIEQLRTTGHLNQLTSVVKESKKLLVRNLTVEIPFTKTIRQKKTVEYDFIYNRISTHDSRSTFVTCMLISGAKEDFIRTKSGHALNSPAFKRYAEISQDIMNEFVVVKQNQMFQKIDLPSFPPVK